MKKFMMTIPDKMYKDLEIEMERRRLDSLQETIRQIISAHLLERNDNSYKTYKL